MLSRRQTFELTRYRLDIHFILFCVFSTCNKAHISPLPHSYLLHGSKQTMPGSTQPPPVAQLCRWSHGLLSSALPAVLCSVLCCTALYCAVLRRTVLARTWADTHSHFCLLLWCLVRGHFQLFELWQEVTPGCSGPSDSEGGPAHLKVHSCLSVMLCFCIIFIRLWNRCFQRR